MSQEVTISSITANTPVDISYCNSTSGDCVFVSSVSIFPYTFEVLSPYDETNFLIKIVDSQNCDIGYFVDISPTPTSTITATPTLTPTITPTNTITQTLTPSVTITNTITSTITPTVTTTPVVAYHLRGKNNSFNSGSTCNDIITSVSYYTYISDANLVPVLGVKVYTTLLNGVLYNLYNGNNTYLILTFNSFPYVVQVNTSGEIVDFVVCPGYITETPTQTPTQTPTPTSTITPTITPTSTITPTITPTSTITPTITPTSTITPTITPTSTITPTQTITPTETPTETPTQTPTETPTSTVTPTQTETPTPTETPTQTQTPTETPTQTQTPTETPTPTQTQTPTITPVSYTHLTLPTTERV